MLDGPIDSAVPDEVRPDLVAVAARGTVQCGQTRPGQAGHAYSVEVDAHRVRLTVADNGVGVPSEVDERSGLLNIRERADRHGGTVTLTGGRAVRDHGGLDGAARLETTLPEVRNWAWPR